MIPVTRFYLLYLQTVLIIVGPSYFVPQKQILGDLKTYLAIERVKTIR